MTKHQNHKTYLDALRLLANFLVLFNHTIAFSLFEQTNSIIPFTFYLLISTIIKINVPLFFMISGTLLLGKEEDLGYILKKRALRIFLLIVVSNTLLYIIKTPDTINLFHLAVNIFTCDIEYSYWFLYAYLAFLLMLPYLRRIVCSFTQKDFFYIMAIHFLLFTIFPLIDYRVFAHFGQHYNLFEEIQLPLMTVKAFFYPIIGYYLDHHVNIQKFTFKRLLQLFAISACGFLVIGVFTFHQFTHFGVIDHFFEVVDYIFAITIFVLFKYAIALKDCLKKAPVIIKILNASAPLTLGIYICEPYLQYFFLTPYSNLLQSHMHPLVFSVLWSSILMLTGGFITFLLKKIPLLKWIL